MAVAQKIHFCPLPTHTQSFENSPPPWVFFVVPLPERFFCPPCWNFDGAHVWSQQGTIVYMGEGKSWRAHCLPPPLSLEKNRERRGKVGGFNTLQNAAFFSPSVRSLRIPFLKRLRPLNERGRCHIAKKYFSCMRCHIAKNWRCHIAKKPRDVTSPNELHMSHCQKRNTLF